MTLPGLPFRQGTATASKRGKPEVRFCEFHAVGEHLFGLVVLDRRVHDDFASGGPVGGCRYLFVNRREGLSDTLPSGRVDKPCACHRSAASRGRGRFRRIDDRLMPVDAMSSSAQSRPFPTDPQRFARGM